MKRKFRIKQPQHRWYWHEFLRDIGLEHRPVEHICGLNLLVDYRPRWYCLWLILVRYTGFQLRGFKK